MNDPSKWAADIEFCRSSEGQLGPDQEVVVPEPASFVDPPRGGIEIIRLEVQRLAPFTDCRADGPAQERGRDPTVPEFRMDVDLLHFPEPADAPLGPREAARSAAVGGDEDETPVEFPRDFLSELREKLPDGGFVCRAIR